MSANDWLHCSFAFPGTYGHECGKPAVLVCAKPSTYTKSGLFYARRCAECAKEKGGENSGLNAFVPFEPEIHRNVWK